MSAAEDYASWWLRDRMFMATLPWPPSVNKYLGHRSGGRTYVTKEAKAYKARIEEITHNSGVSMMTGRLQINIKACPPDKRKRDLDNVLKVLLDSLQAAEVFEDDSQFDLITITREPLTEENKGSVLVAIQPFEAENL